MEYGPKALTKRGVILNKYSIVFHYSIWVCSQGIWNLFIAPLGGPQEKGGGRAVFNRAW